MGYGKAQEVGVSVTLQTLLYSCLFRGSFLKVWGEEKTGTAQVCPSYPCGGIAFLEDSRCQLNIFFSLFLVLIECVAIYYSTSAASFLCGRALNSLFPSSPKTDQAWSCDLHQLIFDLTCHCLAESSRQFIYYLYHFFNKLLYNT